jgi:hypothetical protein
MELEHSRQRFLLLQYTLIDGIIVNYLCYQGGCNERCVYMASLPQYVHLQEALSSALAARLLGWGLLNCV